MLQALAILEAVLCTAAFAKWIHVFDRPPNTQASSTIFELVYAGTLPLWLMSKIESPKTNLCQRTLSQSLSFLHLTLPGCL